MIRPHPPGNVKVNNVMWPATDDSRPDGAHLGPRDRMQQTVYLVTQSEGNIGPEAGVTHTVRFYNENNALQKTLTGLTTTTWTYPHADEATDRRTGSHQRQVQGRNRSGAGRLHQLAKQTRSVDRAGYGLNYGKILRRHLMAST